MANQFAPFACGETQQIDIIKTHTVSSNTPVIFIHPTNRFRNQTLAGTGFTNKTADFTFG
ncbi:Uncharacterised protein [Shigella sonnei]|nr:hypothetical protein [uncultured bacterium]CSP84703.1 Uncharacterised protein [Shigella sonnei]CSR49671.1 Uncharacterised protein [Shigella sonnei]